MFHMKEITKKTKEMEKVFPETKADYLLFDNIINVKGNRTLDLRNEKEMGHGEDTVHLGCVIHRIMLIPPLR